MHLTREHLLSITTEGEVRKRERKRQKERESIHRGEMCKYESEREREARESERWNRGNYLKGLQTD